MGQGFIMRGVFLRKNSMTDFPTVRASSEKQNAGWNESDKM